MAALYTLVQAHFLADIGPGAVCLDLRDTRCGRCLVCSRTSEASGTVVLVADIAVHFVEEHTVDALKLHTVCASYRPFRDVKHRAEGKGMISEQIRISRLDGSTKLCMVLWVHSHLL